MKNFLCILSSLIYTGISAQLFLSGKLTDEQEQPIEYAEVSIKNVNDSTKMITTLTYKMGDFSLSVVKGTYLLSVNYLGKNLLKKKLSVVENINLGKIKVKIANPIGKVTVSREKPLIEQKIDRLVFHVENSVSAKKKVVGNMP